MTLEDRRENITDKLELILDRRIAEVNKDKHWHTEYAEVVRDEILNHFYATVFDDKPSSTGGMAFYPWMEKVKGYERDMIESFFDTHLTEGMKKDIEEWADQYYGDAISKERFSRQLAE